MLRELRMVRQIEGESGRRCFSDGEMDLTVWVSADGMPVGFELCYDKGGCERALRWSDEEGYLHRRVDDGERGEARHKATPVLVPDGMFNAKKISRLFEVNSRDINAAIAGFVLRRLSDYPG